MNEEIGIEQALADKGIFVGTTVGTSMEPLLRTRRDVVVIERPTGRLKNNDVALYRRGERFVLHRVIRVLPESYVILGDNCVQKESVPDAVILGVLTGFYRNGRRFCAVTTPRYRLYVFCVRLLYPFRKVYKRLRRIAAKIWHRFF